MASMCAGVMNSERLGPQTSWTTIYINFRGELEAMVRRRLGSRLAAKCQPHDIVQSAFRTLIRQQRANKLPPSLDPRRYLYATIANKIRKTARYYRQQKRDASRSVFFCDATEESVGAKSVASEVALAGLLEELLVAYSDINKQIVREFIRGASIMQISALVDRAPRTVHRIVRNFEHLLQLHLN